MICFVSILAFYAAPSVARELFEFKTGEKLQVLSAKAFRKAQTNSFEAIGDVIISHSSSAIYGEKASYSFTSKQVEVQGNVRFIAPDMSIYGSKLNYNYVDKTMMVTNARLISDNFIILGKKIERNKNNEIIGNDAEFTTCQDCPESWSVLGKSVKITIGEYAKVRHAYIKIKGVVVMYLPYLVFPIKKERQTGLLFPTLRISDLDQGVTFQQPWFWNIGPSLDLTLTPSFLGKRGYGNELEYRQKLGEKRWFEINSLQAFDRIYEQGKETQDTSGNTRFREFSAYEQHWVSKNIFNHHLYFNRTKDLDVYRDYLDYTQKFHNSSDLGVEAMFDFRTSLMNLSVEGEFKRNQIYAEAYDFDNRYVQTLPKVSLKTTPFTLFHKNKGILKRISTGIEGDFTVFKQNHVEENTFIRNANRVNLAPYVEFNYGNIGPLALKTNIKFDYQKYHFPTIESSNENSFSKRGLLYESEAKIELEKIFGIAYEQEIIDEQSEEDSQKVISSRFYTGDIPLVENFLKEKKVLVSNKSYKHSQIFKLKHYFISDQKINGNSGFESQIRDNDGRGQFDSIDAIREKEFELTHVDSRTELPLSNTLEIQWNNSLIRKSTKPHDPLSNDRYLIDNFNYERIAYFDLSQGYDFNAKRDTFHDGLTRMHLSGGLSFKNFSISGQEFFYHQNNEHIFNFDISQNFSRLKYYIGFNYNTFTNPTQKTFKVGGEIQLSSLFTVLADYGYDLEEQRASESLYRFIYTPKNNCWRMIISHKSNRIDKKFFFNFDINYSNKSFKSVR